MKRSFVAVALALVAATAFAAGRKTRTEIGAVRDGGGASITFYVIDHGEGPLWAGVYSKDVNGINTSLMVLSPAKLDELTALIAETKAELVKPVAKPEAPR